MERAAQWGREASNLLLREWATSKRTLQPQPSLWMTTFWLKLTRDPEPEPLSEAASRFLLCVCVLKNFFFFLDADHFLKRPYWVYYNIALFYALDVCCQAMWDLGSPTRDQTHTPYTRLAQVLTTGLPGKSCSQISDCQKLWDNKCLLF